jgi:hypothetical protein
LAELSFILLLYSYNLHTILVLLQIAFMIHVVVDRILFMRLLHTAAAAAAAAAKHEV